MNLDLVGHISDAWRTPLTVPEKVDWQHALADLNEDYIVATVAMLVRSDAVNRPSIQTFKNAYKGVVASHGPVPKSERASWFDEVKAVNKLNEKGWPKL